MKVDRATGQQTNFSFISPNPSPMELDQNLKKPETQLGMISGMQPKLKSTTL